MKRRQAIDARRGAAAVEFALCASVLFTFIFGTIEISRMFATATNGARSGSRGGAGRGSA